MRRRCLRRAPATSGLLAVLIVALAAPAWPQEEIPVSLRARTFRYDRARRVLEATGDVIVGYRDVTIRADRLRVDLTTYDVRAEGRVRIERQGQAVSGAVLDYNLVTRRGRLSQAVAAYTGPLVLGAVYLRAEVVEGAVGGVTTGRQVVCTTCEGPSPVAYLTADELTVFPGDKIVGRRVSVWIGGRRVFTWPYFVIHLREPRASRLLPVLGYSEVEGYFLKTFYSYALSENHYGYLRLDYLERLGTGVGVEHAYRLAAGEGVAFLYGLANKQTGGADSRVTLWHQHRFSAASARVYADYLARRSPVAPSTDLFVALDAHLPAARHATTLYQTYARFDGAGVFSMVYAGRAIHGRALSDRLWAELSMDGSRAATALGTDDELLPRLSLRYRGPGYTAALTAEARIDLDGAGFPSDVRLGVERLPELTVIGDPVALSGTRLVYQVQGGMGRFRETQAGPAVVDAARADGAVTVTGTLRTTDRDALSLRAEIRGIYYSTGDVRGLLAGRLDYTRAFGAAWQAQMGITYQDQVGRTPFQFDALPARLAQADVGIAFRRPDVHATVTGAYDAGAGRWNPVTARVLYAPRADRVIGGALLYDPAAGGVTRAELAAEVRLGTDWHVSYAGFYDGTTGQVLHDRVSVTRIWYDCLATALTYRGTTREVWMEAWLVALPWARGQIGIGSQGTLVFTQPWWFTQPAPVRP